MVHDTVVRARISEHEKEVASRVLTEMGLTISDAIRIMLKLVAKEGALPSDIRVPNTTARDAIAELIEGRGERSATLSAVMADLNDDTDD